MIPTNAIILSHRFDIEDYQIILVNFKYSDIAGHRIYIYSLEMQRLMCDNKLVVEKYLKNRGKGLGLRLGVKTTGCSGMAYTLEFVDEALPEDQVFESHGIKIMIDPKSLVYIDGTELDFEKEGLNEGFKFNNPNVKAECGCGESFTV